MSEGFTFNETHLLDIEEALNDLFDEAISHSLPMLPVEVQSLSLHIVRKRCRHVLDDRKFFFLSMMVFAVLSAAMFSNGAGQQGTTWGVVAEVIIILGLTFSLGEIVLYSVGHGVWSGAHHQHTIKKERVKSVLSVWSPPRFRRKKGVVDSSFQIQTPLLQHPAMRMDAMLVVLSLLGYMIPPNEFGFERMRYLHGLRCGRLLYGFAVFVPGLRIHLTAFETTLRSLGPAGTLLAFFLVLFGVTGNALFNGALSRSCVMINPIYAYPLNQSTWGDICLAAGRPILDDCVVVTPYLTCSYSTEPGFAAPNVCRFPSVCRELVSPNNGWTSFNNVFLAWLTLIQIVSLSSWSDLMYGVWGNNPQIFVGLYFVAVIVIISFVTLNFVVAIVRSAYEECRLKQSVFFRHGERITSALNFRLSELLYFRFPFQQFLEVKGASGRYVPFFKHPRYSYARNVWLLFLLIIFSLNGAQVSSVYPSLMDAMQIVNLVLFSADVCFSIVAAGSIGKYLTSAQRRYDIFSYVLTAVGVGLQIPLCVFRCLLLMTLFEKVNFLKRRKVVERAMGAVTPLFLMTLVLCMGIFVGSAVALQMFGTSAGPAYGSGSGWVSAFFALFSLDEWSVVMYATMSNGSSIVGVCFFLLSLIVFGYMMQAMYIAVVINAFDPTDEDKIKWQRDSIEEVSDVSSSAADESAFGSSFSTLPVEWSPNTAFSQEQIEVVRQKTVDKSLFLFGVQSKVRLFLARVIIAEGDYERPPGAENPPIEFHGKIFQLVIMLFVLGSCISVVAGPANRACSAFQNSPIAQVQLANLVALDIVWASAFTVEMAMKLIVHGVLFHGDDRPWWLGPTYLRDFWNLLDAGLLMTIYFAFFYPQVAALRLMRILRPLRVIRRFARMRYLINGLFNSLPSIVFIIFISAYVDLIFAVVGVGMFKDQMYSCTVSSIGDRKVAVKSDCAGLYLSSSGVVTHASWDVSAANFDNVGNGLGTLVQLSSFSNWKSIVSTAVSVAGVGRQPVQDGSLKNAVFFFVYIIVTTAFLMNAIIAIIVMTLDDLRGTLFLTLHQRVFKTIRQSITEIKPIAPPPSTRFLRLQRFVLWPVFDMTINTIVLLNIAVIAGTYHNQPASWTEAQFYLNTIFTMFFIVEATLKILSLGRDYFSDPWNWLDLAVVVGSVIEFALQVQSSNQQVTVSSAGRSIRILRIFRSIKRIPALHQIFMTLARALPAMLSFVGVMVIFVFMYAVAGMAMLGQIKHGTSLNTNANFRNLVTAWFTTFRLLTRDGWNLIMADASYYVWPFCSWDEEGWWIVNPNTGSPTPCGVLNDCGISAVSAQLFFYSYFIVGGYLFLNVVVAILLDNFRLNSSYARAPVRRQDLESFKESWLASDPNRDGSNFYGWLMPKENFSRFIIQLCNSGNGMTLNRLDESRHIHPVLTPASRMNFKKIVHELNRRTIKYE